MFYFIFCVVIILLMFGLSSFIDVWFVVGLLQRGVIRRLIAAFYLYEGDLNKQDRFDQSNISNYSLQYVEELELQIL